jgi:hypothetical protein
MKLTPEDFINLHLFHNAIEEGCYLPDVDSFINDYSTLSDENLYKEILADFMESDAYQEMLSELRECYDCLTDLECDWSRHYESNPVAIKIKDKWIGYTYWFGGGKHGQPEMMEWIQDAYYVNIKEEQKMVTVRTFTKAE